MKENTVLPMGSDILLIGGGYPIWRAATVAREFGYRPTLLMRADDPVVEMVPEGNILVLNDWKCIRKGVPTGMKFAATAFVGERVSFEDLMHSPLLNDIGVSSESISTLSSRT